MYCKVNVVQCIVYCVFFIVLEYTTIFCTVQYPNCTVHIPVQRQNTKYWAIRECKVVNFLLILNELYFGSRDWAIVWICVQTKQHLRSYSILVQI